jgi:hypothetical protein
MQKWGTGGFHPDVFRQCLRHQTRNSKARVTSDVQAMDGSAYLDSCGQPFFERMNFLYLFDTFVEVYTEEFCPCLRL